MTWEELQEALAGQPPPASAHGNNAGPSTAGVPEHDAAYASEVVSMVQQGPLGQRLATPLEPPAGQAQQGAGKKRHREPKEPKEPKAGSSSKSGAAKRGKGAAAAVDGATIAVDDFNYLKLPSMCDILEGQAKRDNKSIKQLLYHFKLQLDNASGLEDSEKQKLSREHVRKTAAATMDPTSMRGLPDEEYKTAYGLVLQSSEALPLTFWVNVLHREFQRMCGDSSQTNLPNLLSFLSLGQPTRSLDEARGKNPPQTLAEVPEHLLRPPQRVQVCAKVLLKVVIPAVAAKKDSIQNDVLQLRSSLLPALESTMEKCNGDANPIADATSIRQCVLALAAPFQNDFITSEQLQILTAMKYPKLEHEKVLQVCLDDVWWRSELRSALEKGIYEVQEGPGVKELCDKLGQPGLGDSDFVAALRKLMSDGGFKLWREKMRKIATESLLENMAKQCDDKLTECHLRALSRSREDGVEQTTLATLKEASACLAWLEDILDREENKSPLFSRFGTLLQRTRLEELNVDAQWRLSSGLAHMQKFLAAPFLTEEALAHVSADLEKCRGLRFENCEDADTALNFAEACLFRAPDWKQGARVAAVVLAFVHVSPLSHKQSVLGLTADYVIKVAALDSSDSQPDPLDHDAETLEKTKKEVEDAFAEGNLGAPADSMKDWASISEALKQAQARSASEKAQHFEEQQKPIVKSITEMWQLINRPETQQGWKHHLPENPEWSDVVREIEYSFWRRNSHTSKQAIMEQANAKYKQLTIAFTNFEKTCKKRGVDIPESLRNSVTAVKTATEIADCEEYFVRKIETPDNKTAAKLMKRKVQIAMMNTFKYDPDVHPLIRDRVDKFIKDES